MRGRKPEPETPAKLRLLGSSTHRRPKRNPKPHRSTRPLPVPKFLARNRIAAATWRELAPGLAEQGLLADQDADAFAAYCVAKAQWVQALEQRAKLRSLTVKTPNGGSQQHPLVGIVNKAELAMFRRGEQFGLTGPMTRRRMDLGPEDPDESADDGLSKRRGRAADDEETG